MTSRFNTKAHASDEDSDDDDFDPQELVAVQQLNADSLLAKAGIGGEKPLTASGAPRINNKAGLEEKLKEIQFPVGVNWLETLILTSPHPLDVEDANDDLKREAEFYAVALHGCKTGLAQLNSNNIPFERPADFFAEMVKSDSHMAKIKDVLLSEHKRIEAVAIRKQNVEHRKFAKITNAAKVEQKAKDKREKTSSMDKFKKGASDNTRGSSGTLGDVAMFNAKGGEGGSRNNKRKRDDNDKGGTGAGGGRVGNDGSEPLKKSKKRQATDRKYDKGGRSNEKFRKNDRDSVNKGKFNASDQKKPFNFNKGSNGGKNGGSSGGGDGTEHRRRNREKPSSKQQRPGKSARAAGRS
jgi:rRNA-processing protein EBP2